MKSIIWPSVVSTHGTKKPVQGQKDCSTFTNLTLPPTHKSFSKNVKRAHFQSATWYSTMSPHPPNLDTTLYGWERDEVNKILHPIGIPDGIAPAAAEVLNLIKCTCSSSKPCSSKRCSCVATKVACSLMCSCLGLTKRGFSDETRLVTSRLVWCGWLNKSSCWD